MLSVGTVLSARYRAVRLLGSGAMKTVYLVTEAAREGGIGPSSDAGVSGRSSLASSTTQNYAQGAEDERQAYERARKRAAAEAGFRVHLMSYGGVIGLLLLINLMTSRYPWFLWPALGWASAS